MPRTSSRAAISDEEIVYNLVDGMVENIEDLTSIVRVMADTDLERDGDRYRRADALRAPSVTTRNTARCDRTP